MKYSAVCAPIFLIVGGANSASTQSLHLAKLGNLRGSNLHNPRFLASNNSCQTLLKYNDGKECDLTGCEYIVIPKGNIYPSISNTCGGTITDGDTQSYDALCNGEGFTCQIQGTSNAQPTSEPTSESTPASTSGSTSTSSTTSTPEPTSASTPELTNSSGTTRPSSLFAVAALVTSYALMR